MPIRNKIICRMCGMEILDKDCRAKYHKACLRKATQDYHKTYYHVRRLVAVCIVMSAKKNKHEVILHAGRNIISIRQKKV